jgi:hypothetical protein
LLADGWFLGTGIFDVRYLVFNRIVPLLPGKTQVTVHQFVHAQCDLVTVAQPVFLHLFFADEHAVGAVEVFDDTACIVADELCVIDG